MKNIFLSFLVISCYYCSGCIDTYEGSICTQPKDLPDFDNEMFYSPDNQNSIPIERTSEGKYRIANSNNTDFTHLTSCQINGKWYLEILSDETIKKKPGKNENEENVKKLPVGKYWAYEVSWTEPFEFKGISGSVRMLNAFTTVFSAPDLTAQNIPFQEVNQEVPGIEGVQHVKWLVVDNTHLKDPAKIANYLRSIPDHSRSLGFKLVK